MLDNAGKNVMLDNAGNHPTHNEDADLVRGQTRISAIISQK